MRLSIQRQGFADFYELATVCNEKSLEDLDSRDEKLHAVKAPIRRKSGRKNGRYS